MLVWRITGLLVVAFVGSGCTVATVPPERAARAGAIARLKQIRDHVAHAVLAGDLDRLLSYSPPTIREDVARNSSMRRELEVYLFGEVQRVLRSAGQVEVRLLDGRENDAGIRSAALLFHDRARVNDAMIEDPMFLCRHDLVDAVAWTFNYVGGHWESVGYPFDAFTDIHCPP